MNLRHLLNSTCILLLLTSCAGLMRPQDPESLLEHQKVRYNLTDKSGEFWLVRESGFKSSANEFIVKRSLVIQGEDSKSPLEKSISISKLVSYKNSLNILMPKISQYNVWLEGQKYFNEMKISEDHKSITLTLQSPEPHWQGVKKIDVPDQAQFLCFYSQVMECALVSGFVQKSLKHRTGQMHFYLIWDGHPYFQQQYVGVNEKVIEKATLLYDGVLKDGENRFSLEVSGQVIFFIVNHKGELLKKFWVSQGFTMLKADTFK